MLRKILCSFLILAFILVFIPFRYVDNTFQPYYNEVMTIIKENCPGGKYFKPAKQFVVFENLPNGDIGECILGSTYVLIFIDRDYWEMDKSEADRFQLMAHEMAHCFIRKNHINDFHNYMSPSLFPIKKENTLIQLKQDVVNFCGEDN